MIVTASTQTAAGPATATAPQPRLVKAAHEFEAQMMQELMKPLTQGASGIGEDGDDSGSNGALGGFASEALAKGLSQHGGLGIATSIIHSLSKSGNHDGGVPINGNQPMNTVMKTPK
jgi:Rod binding domain-containing protein